MVRIQGMIHRKLLNALAKRCVSWANMKGGDYTHIELLRWYVDTMFDRYHRVRTSGIISLSDLKIDSTNASEGIWYEPVPTSCFRQLMQELSINFQNYFFIDFGSGMGRALFLAAYYPFSKVVGVEFSPELHALALNNIKTYRNSRQRCFQICSVCLDAVDFELPEVPSVLFFYSPFRAPVFIRVMDNLMRSLKSCPRSVYILFVGNIPDSIEVLKTLKLSCREVRLRRDYIRGVTKRGLILHSGIAEK